MEVRLPSDKTKADLEKSIASFDDKGVKLDNVNVSVINGAQGTSFVMRMAVIDNDRHVLLLNHFKKDFKTVDELQFTTIGPSVSASLRWNALKAIAVASVALILYLAFAFRKLPRKLSPWKFGALAVLAFIHDVVITAGIFVVISHFTTFEVDTLFVTALLTILAYSANDTIVIYDRIRGALLADNREDLATTVERGLRECVSRTFNTTMASIIMLVTLFVLGSSSIHWFILALIVGTIVGTYSSYFIAAPLLIFWKSKNQRK